MCTVLSNMSIYVWDLEKILEYQRIIINIIFFQVLDQVACYGNMYSLPGEPQILCRNMFYKMVMNRAQQIPGIALTFVNNTVFLFSLNMWTLNITVPTITRNLKEAPNHICYLMANQ
jgi:hypothetical protein